MKKYAISITCLFATKRFFVGGEIQLELLFFSTDSIIYGVMITSNSKQTEDKTMGQNESKHLGGQDAKYR